MRNKHKFNDYEPVTRSARAREIGSTNAQDGWPEIRAVEPVVIQHDVKSVEGSEGTSVADKPNKETPATKSQTTESWITKRGHSVSYAGLFVFTFLVYFRPYELFPSLAWLSKSALLVALFTLAAFIPTQLSLENRITAKPREIKLAVALLITGLLSIPLALEPSRALQSFVEFSKVIAIFIVMVNVVRTEKRLRALMLLVLLASCLLSIAALNDYAQGNLALQGRRIAGLIGGLFSNPNDLALHLVTMIPISLTLMLGSRRLLNRALYLGCSLLLMAGMVATFSRGGFLGFVCVMGFMVWKLARRHRVVFAAVALIALLAIITIAPSSYRSRLATTDDASAVARTDDLKRSMLVAARHPVFGVGMDNYIIYSNTNKTTHNAYTQVAAEMGLVALLIYFAFLITPFRYLSKIEHATWIAKGKPRLYYLSIGIQASLVAYMVVSFFASVAYLWYAYYLVAYSICLRRISHATDANNVQRDQTKSPFIRNRSTLQPVDSMVRGN
jgi:putative inorganic carbon (HCO3(-)) transporter